MKKNIHIKHIALCFALVFIPFQFYGMGGPGGGGGGDCFQYNTQGQIISCTNCTVSDGIAAGDIASDPNLIVTANDCGPVTLMVEYTYDWNQGSSNNWIHGISFNAGPNWTSFEEGTPADWLFMPSGVTGCCSGSSYGSGYYYDGTAASSAGDFLQATFMCTGGGGNCTATWTNPNPGDCNTVCNEVSVSATGSSCCNGLDWTNYFNYGLAWTLSSGANDGDPGNNWGVECGINSAGQNTGACPTFTFELTYCPTNSTPSDFTEYITFTTSADGESGCWCLDQSCDYANGFNVTIQNACGPEADFNDPPDDYCTAADFNLGNISAGYDGGHSSGITDEWTGAVVNGSGLTNATFSYCDNIGNTSITHIVGENECYDGPFSETFEVWTPEITNVSATPDEGCGTVNVSLSADVKISGSNTNWGGGGTLEWYDW